MSKRFIDSDIWKKQWFCDLSPALKSFWIYIFSNCDNSGVWEINIPLAQFQIGAKITEEEILNDFSGNIIKIANNKMFVVDFISFQYGKLQENCIPHRNIFRLLEKHGIQYPINTLSIPVQGVAEHLKEEEKDKEEDKDKDKEEEKEKEKKGAFILPDHLKTIWPFYLEMRKLIKKPATENAQESIVLKLEKLAPGRPEDQVRIVQQSIDNSWQGVFELKQSKNIKEYDEEARKKEMMSW